jgi:translocation and assembly module TamB
MTRRKLVALVGAVVLLALGLVVFTTGLFVLHTNAGRSRLREAILPFVKRKLPNAQLYIGHISGSFIDGLTIDSVAIRDKRGDLFLSTGPITVSYNWRDLIDNRIYIRKANVEHPYVHVVQHESGVWNFKEIFASNQGPTAPKNPEERNLGDFIVLDSTTARNVTFLLTMPWHPDESLRGAARDSVIRYHLTHAQKAVTKTFDGYGRTYAWRNGRGLLSHVRLADPDSDKFGREFRIATLSVDEFEPTFQFRNLRGAAQLKGNSVFINVPHFDLPASTAHAVGKVWWGSDRPPRYDITIHGDSVSLNDVNWVYPTLPRTGGGTLDLVIRNDPKNDQIVDFQLHRMDVRSTGSHLVGDMWFGTGAPVLLVRNVDLHADPVDFDLLRTLAGKPFPEDWRGQIFGTVKGRGGPLTNFYVDDARGRFEDAHVRGATSNFSGKGELNILVPALTEFHGFDVNAERLDLRTIEYLFPSFPKLNGIVSGTATLDSSWLDVRFANAQLAHQDGPGEPSRASGSGRVTYGALMDYDLTLNVEPLNLSMLARSPQFTGIPVMNSLWSGPLRVRGTAPDLELATALQGPNGAFSFDGRADLDTVGGLGAHGQGQFSGLDLAALFAKKATPSTVVSGHYDVDLTGQTAATLSGTANVSLDPTVVDSVRVYGSQARLRFADGLMTIDTLRLRTSAFTATAFGALGLPKGRPDSLRFTIQVDSLGGLRPLLPAPDTTLNGAAATPADSLSGTLTVTGMASGTFDRLNLSGRALGNELYYNRARGATLNSAFDFRNVLNDPSGVLDASIDTVTLAGVALERVGGRLTFADSSHARFNVTALSQTGPAASAVGDWSSAAGTQLVVVDTLGLTVGQDRWNLSRPARVTMSDGAVRVDSLVLHNRDTAYVALSASVPDSGAAYASVHAAFIPLGDVGTLFQLPDTLKGVGDLTIAVSGTKAAPAVALNAGLDNVHWSGVNLDRVSTDANYRDRQLTINGKVVRDQKTAVTAAAKLPVEITLPLTLKRLNSAMSASLETDTTDLSIVQTIMPQIALDSVRGRFYAKVDVSGTQRNPVVNGVVSVRNGSMRARAMGVSFNGIAVEVVGGGDAAAKRDSITLAVVAHTGAHDSLNLGGTIRNLSQGNANTTFALRLAMDSVHALNRRSLAELYLSTPDRVNGIRLEGSLAEPVVTGAINVDRGSIFLADRDIARKLAVEDLGDTFSDTTRRRAALGSSNVAKTLLTNLVIRDATVTLGQDVRLRSAEANVRLAGTLSIAKSATPPRLIATSGQFVPGLTLNGQVTTVSGTYNLNLGLVQREFTVLPEGTVTYDGGAPETPLVDIKAQYRVPRYHDRDLNVIVNLKGRLPNPRIEFNSDAEYDLSQSDILSYLITGQPGFDFGANQQASQVIASFLSPTISAVAADRLRQSLPWLDAFRLQLGTSNNVDAAQGGGFFSSRNLSNYLYSSTIAADYQVTTNMFLSLSTGFCQISTGPLNSVGAKVEYRFDPKLSLQLSYDPPSQTRSCGQQSLIGLAPPPGQFGFSLFHTWRF